MRILASICLVAVLATGRPSAQDIGQALPPWTPGSLDIHHISTGLGNATFIRLPGGVTLLVDAGGANRIPYADPKPNDTKRPGEWIAEYIRGTVGEGAAVDYTVLTHFHPDHIGGLADVSAAVPIRRIIDRGSPSYAYLKPAESDAVFKAYQAVLAGQPRQMRGRSGITARSKSRTRSFSQPRSRACWCCRRGHPRTHPPTC